MLEIDGGDIRIFSPRIRTPHINLETWRFGSFPSSLLNGRTWLELQAWTNETIMPRVYRSLEAHSLAL